MMIIMNIIHDLLVLVVILGSKTKCSSLILESIIDLILFYLCWYCKFNLH